MYNMLPSPQNLHIWYDTEETCQLCSSSNSSLQHILSGCKATLMQGQSRWRHDRVLRKLAEILETRGQEVNNASPPTSQRWIQFLQQGGKSQSNRTGQRPLLFPGSEWPMRTDLNQQLKFPPEITPTSRRPDIILWSIPTRIVIMAELTVPWEEGMDAACQRKKEKTWHLCAPSRVEGNCIPSRSRVPKLHWDLHPVVHGVLGSYQG